VPTLTFDLKIGMLITPGLLWTTFAPFSLFSLTRQNKQMGKTCIAACKMATVLGKKVLDFFLKIPGGPGKSLWS